MNNKGFTLLELFAIISLVSLVLLIAVPQIIDAKIKEDEIKFRKAAENAFTVALEKFEENEELKEQEGSFNCKDVKYDNEYLFDSCIIVWDIKNPKLSDLKITAVSSINDELKYENKKKEELENN